MAAAWGLCALALGYALHVPGWLGAGDAKLLAALAPWLDPAAAGFVLIACAGLLLALTVAARTPRGGALRRRGIPVACALGPPAALVLATRAAGGNGLAPGSAGPDDEPSTGPARSGKNGRRATNFHQRSQRKRTRMAIINFRPDWIRRNLVPAGIAVLLGVAAWIGIGPMLMGGGEDAPPPDVPVPAPAPSAPPPTPVDYPEVLVAAGALPPGIALTRSNVTWQEWREPLDLDAETVVVRDMVPIGAVLGSVVTEPFEPGQRIRWTGILMPGHPGFISAVLDPGMLGFTIEVDRATTSAAIIYPGDYVDVLLVAPDVIGNVPSTRAVVRGARVLAVGSLVMTLNRYGTVSLTDAGMIEPPPRPTGDSYTLEVTPRDAERLALAADVGRLRLAMRPIPDLAPRGAHERAEQAVRIGDVLPPLLETPTVRVIRGTAPAEVTVPS